jgi:hypothetical protein
VGEQSWLSTTLAAQHGIAKAVMGEDEPAKIAHEPVKTTAWQRHDVPAVLATPADDCVITECYGPGLPRQAAS